MPFPNPSSVQLGQHHSLIRELKSKNLLKLILFTGPPRSGTTATAKFGHVELCSHGNINQPGMFAPAGKLTETSSEYRFQKDPRDRNSHIWRRAYDSIYKCYDYKKKNGDRISEENPLFITAKETTHLILPGTEVNQWMELCDGKVLMSIRNPLLQLKSIIQMILDNIDNDVYEQEIYTENGKILRQSPIVSDHFNVSRRMDVRDYRVHGHPLFQPDFLDQLLSDGLLKQQDSNFLSWQGVYRYMKSHGDFSGLNSIAFKLFALYTPFLEEPEVQEVIWTRCFEGLPADHPMSSSKTSVAEIISRYKGSRFENFHDLPDLLLQSMFEWRMGWWPTKIHLEERSFADLFVSDFELLRSDYSQSWDQIKVGFKSAGWNYLDSVNSMRLDYDICPDLQCTPLWQAWFMDQDYRKVSSLSQLQRPNTLLPSAEKFPECVQELLPLALGTYKQALSEKNLIKTYKTIEDLKNYPTDNESLPRFEMLDPLTVETHSQIT
jgi:hypothetical protein